MLVALQSGEKTDALLAKRENIHVCPNCNGEVTLKRGRKVIAHFAHKPPTNCSWQNGETRAHLDSKRLLQNTFQKRGLRAEVEFEVETLTGDRRADVMVWSPKTGVMVAFELQHSKLHIKELEERAYSYASAGIAQIWIPFMRSIIWENGKPSDGYDWFVSKYTAPQFERWIHGLNGKDGMWMYDPIHKNFWHARLSNHQIYIEETSWYSEGGEENYGGGFYKTSKRYKELQLTGPTELSDLKIKISTRKQFNTPHYNWPEGLIARLVEK